jgi:hypothetical protein
LYIRNKLYKLPEQIYVYVSNKFYKLPEKTFVRTEKICIHVEQIQQIAEIKNLYVPSKYVYVSNKFYKILKYKKILMYPTNYMN